MLFLTDLLALALPVTTKSQTFGVTTRITRVSSEPFYLTNFRANPANTQRIKTSVARSKMCLSPTPFYLKLKTWPRRFLRSADRN